MTLQFRLISIINKFGDIIAINLINYLSINFALAVMVRCRNKRVGFVNIQKSVILSESLTLENSLFEIYIIFLEVNFGVINLFGYWITTSINEFNLCFLASSSIILKVGVESKNISDRDILSILRPFCFSFTDLFVAV